MGAGKGFLKALENMREEEKIREKGRLPGWYRKDNRSSYHWFDAVKMNANLTKRKSACGRAFAPVEKILDAETVDDQLECKNCQLVKKMHEKKAKRT